MSAPVCSSSRWWSAMGEADGFQLLDQHVRPSAEWQVMAKTGAADVERAIRLTEMKVGSELRLLEIGCGAGRMTWSLAERFGEVVAVDVCDAYLRAARRHCPASNVTFRRIENDALGAGEQAVYDVAFSYEVLHYLAPALFEHYLAEIHSLLRPGGQFVFEMNTEPWRWTTRGALVVRRLLHACGRTTWRGWPTSPHFVRKLYQPDDLVGRLTRAGFLSTRVVHPGRRQTWFVATKPLAEDLS